MSFRALLVTRDDRAVEALAPVLSNFGLSMECCGYPDAVCLVREQKFQAVLVDFDDPHSAALVLQHISSASFENHAKTVALLADKSKVRNAVGTGANFVLYKPVSAEQAEGTLRAATSLMKYERRASDRVAVQVPVKLEFNGGHQPVDGILLDLSEHGMDVLASQPLHSSANVSSRFTLPDFPSEVRLRGEVAWANPNGESGIRFVDTLENLSTALRRWLRSRSKQTRPEDSEPMSNCKLTDLSIGGCYVDTPSPLPERTGVSLTLRTRDREVKIHGFVRVMLPSQGMGIEFDAGTGEQARRMEDFIEHLQNHSDNEPELLVAPAESGEPAKTGAPPSDIEDPLLELIRNYESYSPEVFLRALKSQRKAQLAESK